MRLVTNAFIRKICKSQSDNIKLYSIYHLMHIKWSTREQRKISLVLFDVLLRLPLWIHLATISLKLQSAIVLVRLINFTVCFINKFYVSIRFQESLRFIFSLMFTLCFYNYTYSSCNPRHVKPGPGYIKHKDLSTKKVFSQNSPLSKFKI